MKNNRFNLIVGEQNKIIYSCYGTIFLLECGVRIKDTNFRFWVKLKCLECVTTTNKIERMNVTSVVRCLHLSVPAKMFKGNVVPGGGNFCGH